MVSPYIADWEWPLRKYINYLLKDVSCWPQVMDPCLPFVRFTDYTSLRWRQNGCESVSNHQPHDCLLNRLFRRRSKQTSKLRVTGLCAGNSPGAGEFPAQMASYAENVSIWWRHHVLLSFNVYLVYRMRWTGAVRWEIEWFDYQWTVFGWWHMMMQMSIVCMDHSVCARGTVGDGVTCNVVSRGDRWIPRTKASDAELWCILWSAPE